jgi:hypothetical protein
VTVVLRHSGRGRTAQVRAYLDRTNRAVTPLVLDTNAFLDWVAFRDPALRPTQKAGNVAKSPPYVRNGSMGF